MKKILVIDTETTGLDPNINSIWQIAGYYRNSNGQVFTLNLKCQPLGMENITDEALRVCHITREELLKLPPASEIYHMFRNFLLQETADGERITWIGYNCNFDKNFVEAFFKHFDPNDSIFKFFSRKSVDMLEFMKLLETQELLFAENLKIETVYRMFNQGTETAHDALEDARLTYALYQYSENLLRKSLNHGVIRIGECND